MRDEDRDEAGMLPPGEAWRRLRQNRRAMIGLVILLIIVLVAIFAPLLAPHDPHERHEGMKSSCQILWVSCPSEQVPNSDLYESCLMWVDTGTILPEYSPFNHL